MLKQWAFQNYQSQIIPIFKEEILNFCLRLPLWLDSSLDVLNNRQAQSDFLNFLFKDQTLQLDKRMKVDQIPKHRAGSIQKYNFRPINTNISPLV